MRDIIANNMFENLIAEVLGFLYWLSNLVVCRTIRFRVVNARVIEDTHERGQRALIAGWHGKFFPAVHLFRGKKICMLPVLTLRGKILASSARLLRFKTVHYPESGKPGERIAAVNKILNVLKKEGYDSYLLVDGPPRLEYHRSNPGLLFLSQKTGFPLVPIGIHMQRKATLFWRWDKFEVPLPFSSVTIALGEPFQVPDNIETAELDNITRELDGRIERAEAMAAQAGS